MNTFRLRQPTRKLVLHIGSDKAGSTAIQSALWEQRRLLREEGLYILDRRDSSQLFDPFDKEKITEVRKEFDSKSYSQYLLSWEGMHFFGQQELQFLAETFRNYDIHAVFYVRDQAEVIQSGLMQEVKEAARRVLFSTECQHHSLPDNRNYYRTIHQWNNVIPSIHWDVVLYDRSQFPDQNIAIDFFERLGVKLPIAISSNESINPSLDVASVRLIDFLETLYLEKSAEWTTARRRDLVDLLLRAQLVEPQKDGIYYLAPPDIERIRNHYLDGNKKLVARYGVSLRLLSKHPLPTSELSTEDHLEFAFQRLLKHQARYSTYPLIYRDPKIRAKRDVAAFLANGWHPAESWGCWCSGHESTIQFRIPLTAATQQWDWAEIALQGRYVNSEDQRTEVMVNGENQGHKDLTQEPITIERNSLREDHIVNITLRHSKLYRPQELVNDSDDRRELSFGIRTVSISYEQS